MQDRKEESKAPLGELIRKHKKAVLYSTMIFIGNNAAGYLLIAFFISYATKSLKMPDRADPAGHHAGVLRLADLHPGRRLALGQDRPRQDLPDRLRHRLRLDDPDVRADRHQEHRALRRRAVRPDHRPGPVLRPDVRHVRRDVPGQRPLLRHLHRLRLRRDPGRRVRGHDRRGAAAGHRNWTGSIGIYIMVLCVISLVAVSTVKETKGKNLRVEDAHQEYLQQHPEARDSH